MKGRSKDFLNLSISFLPLIKRYPLSKPLSPTWALSDFCPLSTTTTTNPDNDKAPNSESNKRDPILLEKFRQRKLKVSSTPPQKKPPLQSSPTPGSSPAYEKDSLQNGGGPTKVVNSFGELGLSEEVIAAVEEMGAFVPTEIQCVGIPAVFEGKSVVMSAQPNSGRTLAYLLPLVQLMRRGPKPQHPQAVVLCATEEQSDEVFHMAKFISNYAQLKSTKENGSPQKNLSNVSIGMIVGTPGEVLQHIEEGIVVLDEIKYLVLDEVDAMFGFGLGPDIQKIITPLRYHSSKSDDQGIQTILVTSTIAKILGEGLSPFLERLEHDHAGQIAAMLLEVDKTEVYHLTESLDALKKKVAEAIISLNTTGSES
ncbi:hypothetical protein I3842_16G007300 [Carya illinoinensis]|uniref:Uncharacterized protein n=1 Tax=Carya illinoinensis TaxID=32201 RepID=A0A922D843_CARIL|nr:hypothetical protein I3842_16G007300 [Carya illinoinensis]